jgi:alpha-tubulin suppressor-like RCC1 family protein
MNRLIRGMAVTIGLAVTAALAVPAVSNAAAAPAAALATANTAYGFGTNSEGQLGDGTVVAHSVPAPITTLGSAVVQVAAGSGFGVALLTNGTVWTWGSNSFGQLGDGTFDPHPLPRQVPNLTGVTQIAAGLRHVLALTSSGTVLAWGANSKGQAGTITGTIITVPTAVLDVSGATQIAAGDLFSMAIVANGTVLGWGDNSNGQLGTGLDFSQTAFPFFVRDLTGVSQIAAGSSHAIARRTDGAVWTWGADNHLVHTVPVQVAGLSGVISVAAGDESSFAVTGADGGVWSWGANGQGRLGDGTTTDRFSVPARISLSGVSRVVAAANLAAAVLADGSLWTWGENASGQLGLGTTSAFEATPQRVRTLSGIVSVSMGHGNASLAVGALQTLAIVPPPTPKMSQVNVATSLQVTATGGNPAMHWSAAGLPPGLAINATTGLISGTATSVGQFDVVLRVTDSSTPAQTAIPHTFTWIVNPGACWKTLTDTRSLAIPDQTTVVRDEENGCFGNASANSKITLNIAHSFIGDLIIDLVAPDGTAYRLWNRAGGSGDTIEQTFPRDLSAESMAGIWRLRITDAAAGDTGTLLLFQLQL